MIIVHNILGNAADEEWQGRLAGAAIDVLALDQWEAQKSRLRKRTAGAVELALSLDRTHHLHDGDVLVWDEAERRAIVARIALNDVMIVDLGALKGEALDVVVRTVSTAMTMTSRSRAMRIGGVFIRVAMPRWDRAARPATPGKARRTVRRAP